MWFVILSTTIVRMKYYYAWLVADAICNASGLGFNGYFADGQTKWDLTTNVDIIGFEVRISRSMTLVHLMKFISLVTVCAEFEGQYRPVESIH